MKTFILLACLAAIASGTKWEDCGSKEGTITGVNLDGCGDEDPCVVQLGSKLVITIDFDATKDNDQVKTWIAVIHESNNKQQASSVSVPEDACAENAVECPLVNGGSYVYKQELPFASGYSYKDDNYLKVQLYKGADDIVCAKVNIKFE